MRTGKNKEDFGRERIGFSESMWKFGRMGEWEKKISEMEGTQEEEQI